MKEELPHESVKKKLSLRVKEKIRSILERVAFVLLSPYRFFRSVCLLTGFLVWVFIGIMGILLYGFFSSMPDFETMTLRSLKELPRDG